MLLGCLAVFPLIAAQSQDARLRATTIEASFAQGIEVLGTSEIRNGAMASIEWGRPSRWMRLQGTKTSAREMAYVRAFRSFKGGDGFNGLIAGIGARWIGTRGSFKNAYFELGSGICLNDGTSIDVNSRFNFASFLGGGFYFSSDEDAPRIGIRWMHISNAEIEPPNRGLNQIELVLGFRL